MPGALLVTIAERFVASAGLHTLVLPGDALAAFRGSECQVWVVAETGADWRCGRIAVGPGRVGKVQLAFTAFDTAALALFHVIVTSAAAGPGLPAGLRDRLRTTRAPIELVTSVGTTPLIPAAPARGLWAVEDGAATSRIGTAGVPLVSDLGCYWRDQFGAYAAGWLHCGDVPVLEAALAIGGASTSLALHPRPDVLAHYPECGRAVPVGFAGYVAGEPGVPFEVVVRTEQGESRRPLAVPDRFRVLPTPPSPVPPAQDRFVAAVNAGGLRVLELGARVVGPEAVDWRTRMPGAGGYVGMDVHPSPHVDLVGDAHRLGDIVAPGSFDAVWSAEVFEHLQMPWLAAAEVNRALRMGGLTFHMAPHTWPVHEAPADYWRFSDAALRVLFGPAFGFEVLQAEMIEPMAIHPPRRDGPWAEMPVFPGYGHAAVLSRKVRELPVSSGMEEWARACLGDSARSYPAADRAAREQAAGQGRGQQ